MTSLKKGDKAPNFSGFDQDNKFHQLEDWWPTANEYRNGAGAPGHAYWQQKVDYVMDIFLDDDKERITGSEKITYHNNSVDELAYLWVQLEQSRQDYYKIMVQRILNFLFMIKMVLLTQYRNTYMMQRTLIGLPSKASY